MDGRFVSVVIGDNCTLETKTTIISSITVGNSVIVAHDVLDNCVVAGVSKNN